MAVSFSVGAIWQCLRRSSVGFGEAILALLGSFFLLIIVVPQIRISGGSGFPKIGYYESYIQLKANLPLILYKCKYNYTFPI